MKTKKSIICLAAFVMAAISSVSAKADAPAVETYPTIIVGKWQPEHGPAWIYKSDGTYAREGLADKGVYKFVGDKLILDNEPNGGTVKFKTKDSFTFQGHTEKKWPFVRCE